MRIPPRKVAIGRLLRLSPYSPAKIATGRVFPRSGGLFRCGWSLPHARVVLGRRPSENQGMQLWERESQLSALVQYAAEARAGQGRLVLLAGEAGVGKSALLEQFEGDVAQARWLWGACDGLFTPAALGPLLDVANQVRGELLRLCRAEAPRDQLFAALLQQLQESAGVTVLVMEDVHWADEATARPGALPRPADPAAASVAADQLSRRCPAGRRPAARRARRTGRSADHPPADPADPLRGRPSRTWPRAPGSMRPSSTGTAQTIFFRSRRRPRTPPPPCAARRTAWWRTTCYQVQEGS